MIWLHGITHLEGAVDIVLLDAGAKAAAEREKR
jgi:hypothetical protein